MNVTSSETGMCGGLQPITSVGGAKGDTELGQRAYIRETVHSALNL